MKARIIALESQTYKAMVKYIERVCIALSILLNVILGGPSNQTFSARNYSWKLKNKPNLVKLIDVLIFWDKDHCFYSWVYFKTTKDLRTFHLKQSTIKYTYNDGEWIE